MDGNGISHASRAWRRSPSRNTARAGETRVTIASPYRPVGYLARTAARIHWNLREAFLIGHVHQCVDACADRPASLIRLGVLIANGDSVEEGRQEGGHLRIGILIFVSWVDALILCGQLNQPTRGAEGRAVWNVDVRQASLART